MHDPRAVERGDYFGRIVRQRELSLGLVTETRYQPGTVLPAHAHERSYLCLIVDGACRERTDRGEQRCPPGTVILHAPGEAHEVAFDAGPARCLNVELAPEGWDPYRGKLSGSNGASRYAPATPGWCRCLRDELTWEGDHAGHTLEGLVVELLSLSLFEPRLAIEAREPAWLATALDYLEAHCHGPVSLRCLARELDLHPSYLARTFRSHRGMTVGTYGRLARLRRACADLTRTREPIAGIAIARGFADQSHLTRIMQQELGVTPSAFRRLTRRARPAPERGH